MSSMPITAAGGSAHHERATKKQSSGCSDTEKAEQNSAAPTYPVDGDTQAALQNLGYRIRSRIALGYNRAQTTHSLNAGWMGTEREVLQSVTNSPRAWSRTQSAPQASLGHCSTYAPFAGLPESKDADGDVAMSSDSTAPTLRKRSREADTEESQAYSTNTWTPSLSFSTTASSSDVASDAQRIIRPLRHSSVLSADDTLGLHFHMDESKTSLHHPRPASPIQFNVQDWIHRTDF